MKERPGWAKHVAKLDSTPRPPKTIHIGGRVLFLLRPSIEIKGNPKVVQALVV